VCLDHALTLITRDRDVAAFSQFAELKLARITRSA
jgi:hypothetical protein